jgi:hypothetical protein
MSTSTSNSSPSLNVVQQAALKAYTKGALTRRDQFASDAEWARTFARNFYHSVDSSVGFLPVYHSLLNTLYNTIAEKATTVKAQPSSAKPQPTTKAQAKQTPSQDHPLLPTPQTQSESFQVKMEKLFKYAWPLVGEYRSLERWAKVQAAQWQMKGNVSHKLGEVAAKLLEMAEDQQKHTQMIEEMKNPRSNHYAAFLQQHWDTRKKFPTHSAWAKVTAKNIQKQLNTTAVDCATIAIGLVLVANILTAPINPSAAKPTLTFAKDFDGMAQEALASLKNFTDESAWARATARNFFHQFNATTPFVTIYSKLLHYADLKNAEDEAKMDEEWSSEDDESEHDEDEDYETESEDDDDDDVSLVDEDDSEVEYEDEADDETLSYTSDESMEKADTLLFTPNGKQTNAEAQAGRIAMNRILFKEYRGWYHAFKEEEDDEFSAEDRFSWHCAKILSQKSGLSREMCQTVVGGWLELNKKTLATV